MTAAADLALPGRQPSRLYRTLLADPPWNLQQLGSRPPGYRLMSVEQIAALPVGRLAASDAHLWLWVTNASLFAGKAVMEAWGFSYRSCLTWIKPRFGMGPYLRNQTEHLLFGIRGEAPVRFHGQGTWLYAPLQEHSHKPEEQYAVIERCSPGPYLELFAGSAGRGGTPGGMRWRVMSDCFRGTAKATCRMTAARGLTVSSVPA